MKIVLLNKTILLKQFKRFFPFVLAIVLLLGITVSCKDKTPKPTPVACTICEARKEIKHYFLFDLGSWWVYEEETTHERDSMYVVQSTNDTNSSDFDTRIFSPYQNYYYHFFPLMTVTNPTTGCTDDAITTKRCIYIKSSKYQSGDYIGEELCFFSQYFKGASYTVNNYYFPNSQLTFTEIYDNYSLGSLSFEKTLKVHIDQSALEHNSPVNEFFVKGVGLVRKEIIDSNQIWNLVDYHVTQ